MCKLLPCALNFRARVITSFIRVHTKVINIRSVYTNNFIILSILFARAIIGCTFITIFNFEKKREERTVTWLKRLFNPLKGLIEYVLEIATTTLQKSQSSHQNIIYNWTNIRVKESFDQIYAKYTNNLSYKTNLM